MDKTYRNLDTGASAPAHRIGTGANGEALYGDIEGWEPNFPSGLTEDGLWVELEATTAILTWHLERLEAGGDDGIEVAQVENRPALVRVYDTQSQCVYGAAELIAALEALKDGAGFAATWQALADLDEYELED